MNSQRHHTSPAFEQQAAASYNLGNSFKDQGRFDEAIEHLQKAISLNPNFAQAHSDLGIVFARQGDMNRAAASFRQSLALKPNFADAHSHLGSALKLQGKLDEAEACYREALALMPDFAEAHGHLGSVLKEQGRLDDAVTCYRKALALRPDFAEAHNDLGLVYAHQGKPDEAASCYRKALALRPDFAAAHSNQAVTFQIQGRPDEAIACYQKALAYKPDDAHAHSNLLLSMQYSATHTPENLFAAHGRFAAQFETPLKPRWLAHPNPREPRKRLKIGYVSPDFHKHPVADSIEPVLARHDKSQVEIFCYYNHVHVDAVTQRLQALADHWVSCKYLSDDALAERIRADGIDILVDLAGHTGSNRLLAFARKPAPVQLTYLGYPCTTGLSAIDYRITDAYAEPPGLTEQFNVEQLWRLPESFC
ncbi:MAG: tetratricopeptide repeat protein, partial [Noviherbaspirillum sp.]